MDVLRFIKNAFLVVIGIVLVSLSVANRHTVSLALNPFNPADPHLTLTSVPLFWVIFASIALGVLLGGMGAWSKQGKWRKEARTKRKEARALNKEAEQLRELTKPSTPEPSFPALGKSNAA